MEIFKTISSTQLQIEQPKFNLEIKEPVKESIKESKDKLQSSEVKKLIDALNDLPFFRDKLQFTFSEDIGQSIVQIMDKKTKEVIRQYPSEELINRILYYRENIGVLFDNVS